MLGQHGRGLTRALFTRPALALARIGVTPNLLTLAGTALTIGVAVLTLPRGHFVVGPIALVLTIVADSFDGILARATGGSSEFGASVRGWPTPSAPTPQSSGGRARRPIPPTSARNARRSSRRLRRWTRATIDVPETAPAPTSKTRGGPATIR